MSDKWNRWSAKSPKLQPSDVLDIVYIDRFNRVINESAPLSEILWHSKDKTLLAWRRVMPPVPEQTHLGTVYWNYINGKFWPRTFQRPPNHKLPYFRIEVSVHRDGTPRFDYFLLDPV